MEWRDKQSYKREDEREKGRNELGKNLEKGYPPGRI